MASGMVGVKTKMCLGWVSWGFQARRSVWQREEKNQEEPGFAFLVIF